MAEDAEAGQLHLDVVADASGFARDLRAKVEAAAAKTRAQVKAKVEFSAAQARTALNNALREGTKDRAVQARVEFSGAQTRAALNRALREGSRTGSTVSAKVEFSGAQTRAALNRALREGGRAGTPVRAQVEFSGTQVRAALSRALRASGAAGNTVRAQVEFSGAQVRAALNRAIREATGANPVNARVAFLGAQVRAALNRAIREAEAGVREPRIGVNAQVARFLLQVEAARRLAERRPVRINVTANLSQVAQALQAVGTGLIALGKIPAIVSGIATAAGALGNLAGALFSVASAASQAVGVLGLLPGLAGAAAQGLGALVLGFSGIGKALQAIGRADQSAAIAAPKAARAHVNSSGQIKAAQQRLADARVQAAQRVADAERNSARQIADAERNSARSIADAQRSVADAQRNVARAQRDLNQALADGREELQQLAFQAREASLSEEQAQISLEHAALKVQQARQSAVMSPLDKREAELEYKQALLDLEEAKDKASDLGKQNKKAQKEGVGGTEGVKRAREDLADANRQLADSERQLAQAQQDGAREVAQARADGAREISQARADAARQVRDAQNALKQARQSAAQTAQTADTTSAAVCRMGYALDQLGPAGQRFVHFIHDQLMPRFRELRNAVQETLLPRLTTGIKAALPIFGTLKSHLAETGKIIGELGIKLGRVIGSRAFQKDLSTIMTANNKAIRSFGEAGGYLASILRDVLVVTSPLIVKFADLVRNWAKGRAEASRTARETGRMRDFFDRAWKSAKQLGGILTDLVVILHNVAGAATPTGNTLLDSLADAADRLRKWTENPQNQKRMHDFFQQTVPLAKQLGDLLVNIVDSLVKLSTAVGGDTMKGFFAVLNTFLDLLNAISDMPGGGTILSTILLLSGAAFGIGLVSRALGKVVGSLVKLSRLTGVAGLLSSLFGGRGGRGGRGGGGRGRSQVGDLADDVEKLTGNIDDEIPKDQKKSRELGNVGGAAGKARKPTKGFGDDVLVAGGKAEKSAAKTGRFSRVLGGLGRVLGPIGKGLAALGTAFLAIPGLGGATAKLGGGLKNAFAKIKLPKLSLGGKGGLAGMLGGLFGGSSEKAFLPKASAFFAGLRTAIGKAAGKVLTKAGLTAAIRGGVKGGAKGSFGGPLGIIGGILASIVGEMIGGGKGGKRGAAGGAISGGATGAAIGGLVGSIFPVIGTTIGAAIGAGLGAIIGAITGGKYWSALGRAISGFFTKTIPDMFMQGMRALPGVLAAMAGKGTDLTLAMIGWIGGALKDVGVWLAKAAISTLEKIPTLMIEWILALPRLLTKAAVVAPDVFEWLFKAAQAIIPKLVSWATWIPRNIVKWIATAAFRAPQAFMWLVRQALAIMPKVGAALRGIPGQIRKAFAHPGDVWAALLRILASGGRKVRGAVNGALRGIAGIFAKAFGDAIRRAAQRLHEMLVDIRAAGGKWRKAWNETFGKMYAAARDKMKAARDRVARYLGNIRDKFSDAKTSVTKRVRDTFNSVRDTISNKMNDARKKVSDILGKIRDAFSSGKDKIYRAWKPVGRLLAGPVNWIGQNVYQKGIKWAWDQVAKLVHMGGLPDYHQFKAGGVLPGYTPGRDVHRFVSPTGGALDMSGGEAVMVPEWTRAVGPRRVQVWNQIARSGGPAAVAAAMFEDFMAKPGTARRRGFSGGGVTDLPRQRFGIGGIFSGVGSFLSGLKDGFAGGLVKVMSKLLDPILNSVAGAMPAGTWGNLVKNIPKEMVTPFLAWLKKVVEPKLGGDAGAVVKAALSMVGQGDDKGPNNNFITREWGMVGAPWCAMFVSEAIKKAKAEKQYPGYPTAAVAGYVGAMNHVGLGEGRPGDLGAYRGTGHINVIVKKAGGGYDTVGGNQNALIQHGVRGGQSSILRPKAKAARGGVFTRDLIRNAAQIFHVEAPRNADRHELDTPLVALMHRLDPGTTKRLTEALVKTNTSIGPQAVLRDEGGVLPPGGTAYNGGRRNEWVLSPAAIDLLGGERRVAQLNAQATRLYRSARGPAATAVARADTGAPPGATATVNVFPQQGQSETEIGMIAARRVGAMLR